MRDIEALRSCMADAAAELGDFSVLVNNVASDDRHSLESVTPDYYDERMAINERPAFFAIQAAVPGMRRLGGGSVVNLGSTGWQGKGDGYPCYAIAKSSVNGLTRGLARTWARPHPHQTVSPGWVMTEPADQALARRQGRGGDRTQPVPARQAAARRTSPAWCCSSPRTMRPCARRRNSRWMRAGSSRPPHHRARPVQSASRRTPYCAKHTCLSALIITLAAGDSSRSAGVMMPKASIWQGMERGSTATMPWAA